MRAVRGSTFRQSRHRRSSRRPSRGSYRPNVVSLSDHSTTLPPLPRALAEALMVVPASTLTVVAVGMAKLSSLALGFDTRLLFGLPPPQSPPISTLPPPARPEAST